MEVELQEIRDFLSHVVPFDQLNDDALNRLPSTLVVRYLRRGTPFPPADQSDHALYIVRRGAVELRDVEDKLVEKLAEGDLYSGLCLSDDPQGALHGTLVEDSLFYLLPCDTLQQWRSNHPVLEAHFSRTLQHRLRRALERQQAGENHANLLTVAVGHLLTRSPVTASPDCSIRDAARQMTAERVSALLLVEEGRLAGIVTDRDLRSRCIADGVSPEQPVSTIMSRHLHKVSRETPAFEALLTMTRLHIHHLPVVDSSGVAGLITTSDLIRQQSAHTVYLVDTVRKAANLAALVEAHRRLPELQVQLCAAGASAQQIGHAVTAVADALTRRLIELAEEELGPAPVAWAWLAGGSQARREQTVHSDQDNALLLADDYDATAHAGWFKRLAESVCSGLAACGYYDCPGGIMASNPQWRQPWQAWRHLFDGWITQPDGHAVAQAVNFLDLRVIHGDERLFSSLQHEVLQQIRASQRFLTALSETALENRPPLGFFRNFVLIGEGDHANTLDLKRRGLLPVVNLARVHVLSAGLPVIGTIERIHAAVDAGLISREGAEALEDAFNFIGTLRARHQASQIKRGEAPDNFVPPEELSAPERGHLKDAFSAIATLQTALGRHHA